jgi:predicted RNA-binding Zn ribbon-like protein
MCSSVLHLSRAEYWCYLSRMTHAHAPESELLHVGGDPALDLVNTVDWTARGPENERLDSFEQLLRWADGAGVLDQAALRRLRRLGADRPRAAAATLEDAVRAREVLHDLFGAIARGEAPGSALRRFNRLLGEATERLEVVPCTGAGRGYEWHWRGSESDLRSVVWRVLWVAANLLRSDELASVRICDGDDCGWMYVDRSRNGLRRWCQMRTCGTREKTRRRRVSGPA